MQDDLKKTHWHNRRVELWNTDLSPNKPLPDTSEWALVEKQIKHMIHQVIYARAVLVKQIPLFQHAGTHCSLCDSFLAVKNTM